MSKAWSEYYRLAAKKWVEHDAAASLQEDLKSATLSEWMMELGDDLPMNRREMEVRASARWRQYICEMHANRKEANLAKVQMEYFRMKHGEEQSANATRRAEMKL